MKLLDYKQEWIALEASRNPFATVVIAHLKAQETRADRSRRFEWKLAITRRLYEEGYEREDVINIFGFIDWMMSLPEALEQKFQQQLSQYEEERCMPYITSIERSGRKQGMREGLLEGIKLGLELKFGNEGLATLPEISGLQDVEQLRAILAGLKTVNTLSELRQIYQPTISE